MKKKILLVDDHDDFRSSVKDYLNSYQLDFVIFEANSGEKGVVKASLIKPDIVIMDISLPNENGFESARKIRKAQPKCKIIILSLFEGPQIKKEALKIKADGFVGKNEVFEKLLPLIKECL